ncbi:MAG: hypothetical protein NVS3B20_27330 [Polyangiales bacterium]
MLHFIPLIFQRSADTIFISGGYTPEEKAGKSAKTAVKVAKPAMDFESSSFWKDRLTRPSWSIAASERGAEPSIELAKAVGALIAAPNVAKSAKSGTSYGWKAVVKPTSTENMPTGSFGQTYDLIVTDPDAPAKPMRFQGETLIVPDGTNRTWSCFGQNLPKGVLAAKLREVMAAVSDAPSAKGVERIGARPGMEFLVGSRSQSGSVAFVDSLVRMLAKELEMKPELVLSQLPEGGKGSVMFRMGASKSGKAPAVEGSLMIPRDVMAATMAMITMASAPSSTAATPVP